MPLKRGCQRCLRPAEDGSSESLIANGISGCCRKRLRREHKPALGGREGQVCLSKSNCGRPGFEINLLPGPAAQKYWQYKFAIKPMTSGLRDNPCKQKVFAREPCLGSLIGGGEQRGEPRRRKEVIGGDDRL